MRSEKYWKRPMTCRASECLLTLTNQLEAALQPLNEWITAYPTLLGEHVGAPLTSIVDIVYCKNEKESKCIHTSLVPSRLRPSSFLPPLSCRKDTWSDPPNHELLIIKITVISQSSQMETLLKSLRCFSQVKTSRVSPLEIEIPKISIRVIIVK